jgi:hypothetical protein
MQRGTCNARATAKGDISVRVLIPESTSATSAHMYNIVLVMDKCVYVICMPD